MCFLNLITVAETMNKINFALCHKKAFSNSLLTFQFVIYRAKTTKFNVMKRSLLLEDMITDKDKRKNWHFNLMANAENKNLKAKCRNVFDKLHKPTRRQSVLNSLFIKNITDVISTGEIAPEVLGYGIEITGVKISPCCRMLNVFWQVPERYYDFTEVINRELTIAAPKIRAELISRNVMGRVPFIFFLRDSTNARIAAFEQALKQLDLPSDAESPIIPDDSFTKNIYSFKTPKVKEKDYTVVEVEDAKPSTGIPLNPIDMKSDTFGLNHDMLMEKVLALKNNAKPIKQSAIISPDVEEGDLFSKIPGICFQADTTRDKILKKFQVERKRLMQRKPHFKISNLDYQNNEVDEEDPKDYILEDNSFLEDFVEEDIKDNSAL